MSNLPIPEEYTGSLCEIKTKENSLISTGRIKEISEKYIKIANKDKDMQIVDYGTLIKINVFNTKLGFRVLVGNVYTSSRSELSIVSIISLVECERRNFFRVDMSMNSKALFKEDESSDKTDETDIIIKDMSLSGIRFISKYSFKTGTPIVIEANLSNKKDISIHCRIVRIINEKDSEGYTNYGCEIIHSTGDDDDTDILCSFLFQKQREFLSGNKSK